MLKQKQTDQLYSVSQKIPPLRFSDIFLKRMGIFWSFYPSVTRSFLR